MVNVEAQEANTNIELLNSNGTELLSWTAEKAYSSIIVSCPEIEEGETYTVKAGTTEQSITMDSLVYGSNASGGGAPGSNGGERGGRKEGGMQGGTDNGQQSGNMEKPQGNTPPDAPSGENTDNGTSEGGSSL